jgi:N-acetyl-alpha-D-glucosaminyl L-malate synthase BshA
MKNIGIVCYPTFGGSGIVASELGKALSKKHQIHFIAYKKPVRFDNSNSNMFFHKVDVPVYPLFEYPPYELALTTVIVEVVEKFSLELIHVHYAIPHAYSAINAQAILLQKGLKIPIVTTLHGTDITLVGKSPSVISAVNYAINKSSVVTAVSESLRLETLKHFDIKQRIRVIPNFITFKKQSISKQINKQKIITHISNFRPVKRVLDVINIFHTVQQKIDSILVMIGDGPDLVHAKKLVEKKKINNKVIFMGKSNKIEDVLKKSDLFLLPSESESFGLVALEAMSFAVPVISSDSGGIVELVQDGVNGYTCRVGDVQAMSLRSIELLSNKNLHSQMRLASYDTAKKYDVNTILPMYEQCYNELY